MVREMETKCTYLVLRLFKLSILNQCQGLHVGEWTEISLHCRLLVMDEIGLITAVIVMTMNERESKIEIGILLPRVVIGHLRLRLLIMRDRGTDLHHRISQDVMRPCMRGERKMYMEEEVGIGVEREIEDMNIITAKGSSLFKCYLVLNIPDTLFTPFNDLNLMFTS